MFVCTKHVCKNVHISIVFNSAKQENTEMYIHSKINQLIVAYICIVKYYRATKMNILTGSVEEKKWTPKSLCVGFDYVNTKTDKS